MSGTSLRRVWKATLVERSVPRAPGLTVTHRHTSVGQAVDRARLSAFSGKRDEGRKSRKRAEGSTTTKRRRGPGGTVVQEGTGSDGVEGRRGGRPQGKTGQGQRGSMGGHRPAAGGIMVRKIVMRCGWFQMPAVQWWVKSGQVRTFTTMYMCGRLRKSGLVRSQSDPQRSCRTLRNSTAGDAGFESSMRLSGCL